MQACEQSNGYWCSDNAQPYVQRPPPLGIQIQVLKHTNTNTYKSQINSDVVIKSPHLSNLPFPLWMHGRPMFKNHPWEIVNKILSLNHFFTFCLLQNQQSKKKLQSLDKFKVVARVVVAIQPKSTSECFPHSSHYSEFTWSHPSASAAITLVESEGKKFGQSLVWPLVAPLIRW